MARIFISYRREDTESTTGRIYERLVQEFGKPSVMMDIDNIPFGVDFRDYLQRKLAECEVVIAVVGTKWLGPRRGRQPRINDDSDWVKLEIETALDRKVLLIPVLVHSAQMPTEGSLPTSIKPFSYRHAATISTGRDFHVHLDRLIDQLNREPATEGQIPDVPLVAPTEAKTAPSLAPAAIVVREQSIPSDKPNVPPASFDCPRDRHLFGPGPKWLLALDGGGLRSIATIAFLERIESILSQRHGRQTNLAHRFDLVGGPSTGGIVASMLALDYRMADVKTALLEMAQRFKRPFWRIAGLQSVFNKDRLFEGLDRLLGDRSLGSLDLVTGLCLLMKRLDTGQVWLVANNPRMEQWNTPDDFSYIGQRHYQLARLVRAAAAAPHFFDPEIVALGKNEAGLFVDGGMSVHNNPALALFMMVASRTGGLAWPTGPERLKVVSIGAGSYRSTLGPSELGWAKSIKVVLHSLMSLAGETQEFVLGQMQALGTTPTPWTANTINGLDILPQLGSPQFQFLRYDLQLESRWLADNLGLNLGKAEVSRLRNFDDPTIVHELYEIAAVAAERQVKPEHFADSTFAS